MCREDCARTARLALIPPGCFGLLYPRKRDRSFVEAASPICRRRFRAEVGRQYPVVHAACPKPPPRGTCDSVCVRYVRLPRDCRRSSCFLIARSSSYQYIYIFVCQRDPSLVARVLLQPGECVIIDNQRTMHGRESFKVRTPRRSTPRRRLLHQACSAKHR